MDWIYGSILGLIALASCVWAFCLEASCSLEPRHESRSFGDVDEVGSGK